MPFLRLKSFTIVTTLPFPANLDVQKRWFTVIALGLAFLLSAISLDGLRTPVYAVDSMLRVFGERSIKLRLYADYFCTFCWKMEPEAESLIADLVEKEIVTITFIDTPYHRLSSLYAQYFLYTVTEGRGLKYALAVRRALIDAAKEKLDSREKLEASLKQKGFTVKPFDTKPVFDISTAHFLDDGIKSTPTCVIEKDVTIEKYTSQGSIIKALKKLQQKKEPSLIQGMLHGLSNRSTSLKL
jgi:predicted DsbA family dithiol-disulfide isomerase